MAATAQQTRLMTARDVADQLGIHPRSVWRMSASGELPAPIRLSARVVRWRPDDIERAIEKARRG